MPITKPNVVISYIGHDEIDLDIIGLSDVEVLKATALKWPNGLNLFGNNLGPVWVHPDLLLALGQEDEFGLDMIGMAHSAAELLRLAADIDKAETLGAQGVDRMVAMFSSQARAQANAKRPNQLHAHRWGAACKVVLADRVEPGVVEIHPEGRVAARFAKLFGCVPGAEGGWADLENRWVMIKRHPFILGYVAQIKFNEALTKNLILANRLDFRKATQGDADGDQAFEFAIPEEQMALDLQAEIQAVVLDNDATGLVLGRPCASDPEWWGEVIDKNVNDKLNQSFTKTITEWIESHIKMADYANRLTPFAYRLSDIGGAMAAVGIAGAREAALIGATIEETFYLGLAGGPKELDDALDIWFRKKMSNANQSVLFTGLAKVVNPELLRDQDVLVAIARASAINKGNFDPYDPQELLTHMAFLVGKGRITQGDGSKLELLQEMAADPNVNPELRDGFLAKMLFHAGRKLAQVVGKGKPVVFTQELSNSYREAQEDDEYIVSSYEES